MDGSLLFRRLNEKGLYGPHVKKISDDWQMIPLKASSRKEKSSKHFADPSLNFLIMPILRQTTENQPNQSEAFNKSVSSVPMAMSMMVDSLVNMMQSNLPQTHQNNSLSLGLNQDEY